MQRVARRQVVVTWEPERFEQFWLVQDYLSEEPPEALVAGSQIANQLHNVENIPLPVPHDCTDGVFGAYWRRPEAYLDPAVRASISGLALREPDAVHLAMARLKADIRSGAWTRKHADLLDLDELDLGYCVLVGEYPLAAPELQTPASHAVQPPRVRAQVGSEVGVGDRG
jgi:hypothetical protein